MRHPRTRNLRAGVAHRRRGAALVVAMVCLLLISLSLGALLQIARVQMQQARRGEDRLQSEWLAESALERAAARLAADGEYEGETWDLTAEEFGRQEAGTVSVKVEEIPGRESSKRVTVVARFPKAGARAVQTTKTIEVTIN